MSLTRRRRSAPSESSLPVAKLLQILKGYLMKSKREIFWGLKTTVLKFVQKIFEMKI